MKILIISFIIINILNSALCLGSCREARLCCPGRDSSCLVQKSPINSIIEDINEDKPCYCDGACITLGDCCHDYKQHCGVTDCEVNEWDKWSDCDVQCGYGTMTRSRSIRVQPANGGRDCPELLQKRGCHGQKCEIRTNDKSEKETALILPSHYSMTRAQNETWDIRRNLRLRYPKDPIKENSNEYCVEFEIIKSRKACDSLGSEVASRLQQGGVVRVQCQEAAMRKYLEYKCHGDGVDGKVTRWTSLATKNCHGRWIRRSGGPCYQPSHFIFV